MCTRPTLYLKLYVLHDLISFDFWRLTSLSAIFQLYHGDQFLVVEETGEPPTMGKQLVNFITCGCELRAPFFVIYKVRRGPTPYW